MCGHTSVTELISQDLSSNLIHSPMYLLVIWVKNDNLYFFDTEKQPRQ